MKILSINTKSSLVSILKDDPDGINRNYLIEPDGIKLLEKQVKLFQRISIQGHRAFINVKFNSRYHNRDKRLEIVSIKNHTCYIYKFSTLKKIDKDALELERIIDEAKEANILLNFNYKGNLIVDANEYEDSVKTMTSMKIDLNIIAY